MGNTLFNYNIITESLNNKEKKKLILNNKELLSENKKIYKWKRDLPDHRDSYYKRSLLKMNKEKIIDLRYKCPEIYNQGELGSCTANALAFLFEYDELLKNKTNTFTPSRLFIYYNERKIEDTINIDSGASIRDGIKTINKIGVCDEKLWPYDIDKFKNKPTNLCYGQAKKYKSIKYYRLEQNLDDLKGCLNEGYPFVIGLSIYESFEDVTTSKTGMVPIPKKTEKLLGGHALAVVGYDDNYGFIVRNSWGKLWGIDGYCFIPYDYICNKNLATDFWTIRTITF